MSEPPLPSEPFRPGEAPEASPAGVRAAALSAEDLITLNEEIAGLARAGLPLDQGLSALAREMGRGRLQRVTAQLASDLQAGHPLPEALARQGSRVPPFYAGLVEAGLRTGRIGEVLATLTVYTRALADLRSAVLGALYYPALVVAVALVLFGVTSFMLVPQFEQFFKDFKLKMPGITRFVLDIGKDPFPYVIAPILILVALVLVLRLVLRHTAAGRRTWARLIYAIPVAGKLVQAARLSAFTELLAILVDHAVPLPEAFRLAGAASSDPTLADSARRIEQDLSKGEPLGAALKRQGTFPQLVAWMSGVGELRGSLGPTLHQVAALYRRQTEMRAAVLTSILPPILVLITAAILVTLFVLCVVLPLVQIWEGMSKITG